MNPYRMSAVPPDEPRGKPRSKLKTLWYKLQIKVRGTWKQRFERCNRCLAVFPRVSGDYLNPGPMFHAIKHHAEDAHVQNVLKGRRPIVPPDPITILE